MTEQQKEFEAWYHDRYGQHEDYPILEKTDRGNYRATHTRGAWKGWQAANAIAASKRATESQRRHEFGDSWE